MKSQKNIQKLYADLLVELEKVEKTCLICGEVLEKHSEERDLIWPPTKNDPAPIAGYCNQGDYSRHFKLNDFGIQALQNRRKVFELVLDQEENYVSMDDCIMPETIVGTFHDKANKLIEFDIQVDDLDEPYRTILLNSSNKLAIQMPAPLSDKVQIISFCIFPGGQIYRNWQYITEDILQASADLVEFLRTRLNLELSQELKSRYGG